MPFYIAAWLQYHAPDKLIWYNLHTNYTDTGATSPKRDWLCWSLKTRQSFWVILCCLPEIEEISEEMKERDRKRKNEEQEWKWRRNKNTSLYPYLLQG